MLSLNTSRSLRAASQFMQHKSKGLLSMSSCSSASSWRSFSTTLANSMKVVHPNYVPPSDQSNNSSAPLEEIQYVAPDEDGSLASPSHVTFYDIEEAFARIRPLLPPTPLQESMVLTHEIFGSQKGILHPRKVHLKYENKHMTGSFKERGAINKLASLTAEQRERGVVASSAGNHAQAVAYHAMRLGIKATICMPENTPLAKVAGTKRYGAEVVLIGESIDDAYQEALRIKDAENRVLVHPFNDNDIIAGQGSLGLELLEQSPYIDTIVCPIGGGGLISGTAIAVKTVNPKIKVYGVQTENIPSMITAKKERKATMVPFKSTIADGIAVKRAGDLTFPIVDKYVDDIVSVSESEIAHAVLVLLEREKTLVEGAGATAVAALLSGKLPEITKPNSPLTVYV
ncbi:hypothetical protein C9374_005265 [Naegleria lovaniensis]|uniref:Tryptophan synthase beta chain-like PALP domain-containing protein n=1 Tax=Naegleria lovaniensis TaxID=51637 RepID=A0AA88KKJ3_NAELO|nr:uncharacterized protein C9374_005265 [Naegleria lovaniensis]KAG2382685.1 hypothetical protein C9374_005265 [Naegleria lovaniensis]